MPKHILLPVVVCLVAQAVLSADFQYQEKTQITGGTALAAVKVAAAFSKQARQATDPIVNSVFIRGNRMARVSAASTEIIDLDDETITNIDHNKKQYTVTTFEQLRRQMERAATKMGEAQATKQQPAAVPSDTRMDFDVKVRETGATKDLSGLNAKEAILSLTVSGTSTKTGEGGALAMTNDMWMVDEIPGYSAVREFYLRYGAKMGVMVGESFSRSLAAMPSGMVEGTAAMVKEISRLKGMPLLQVMRIGLTVNGQPLPASSEAPLSADSTVSMPSGSDIAKSAGTAAATSALESRMRGLGGLAGGMGSIGGFGGFGKSKKKPEAPVSTSSAAAAAPAYGVLLESSSEMSGFSSAPVDASKFQRPDGYKQVTIQEKL